MQPKVIATLIDGRMIEGRLTTDHSASSYNQPVFVDDEGQAYDAWQIVDIKSLAQISPPDASMSSV